MVETELAGSDEGLDPRSYVQELEDIAMEQELDTPKVWTPAYLR